MATKRKLQQFHRYDLHAITSIAQLLYFALFFYAMTLSRGPQTLSQQKELEQNLKLTARIQRL